MKLIASSFDANVDEAYSADSSIILRYRHLLQHHIAEEQNERIKELLKSTSLGEGARIVPFLTYRGVNILLLDETSLMHTHSIKSIDGCLAMAECSLRGWTRVAFESGGNTGAAFTAYGHAANLETFLFVPEENLSLLESTLFEHDFAHLISVANRRDVKKAAEEFHRRTGIPHIPRLEWRYHASRFRGAFILEYLLGHGPIDWFSQTISAAFGPIGIYQVLSAYASRLGELPRFLGVQQSANCPMYRAWKGNGAAPVELPQAEHPRLLSRVMYDTSPQTYGTLDDLGQLLARSSGNLTLVDHTQFREALERDLLGKPLLEHLDDKGIQIGTHDGQVIDPTGLIALVGTFSEIDRGTIQPGNKVLCSISSGVTDSDGRAAPEFRIASDVEAGVASYIGAFVTGTTGR